MLDMSWHQFQMLLQAQDVDYSSSTREAKQDSGLLTRPDLEQMITWETNNLYEYLKELYDHQHEDMVDDRFAGSLNICL